MFSLFAGLFNWLFSTSEINVLIIGFDNAGKTVSDSNPSCHESVLNVYMPDLTRTTQDNIRQQETRRAIRSNPTHDWFKSYVVLNSRRSMLPV